MLQVLLNSIYNSPTTMSACKDTLMGRKWQTSNYFPGPVVDLSSGALSVASGDMSNDVELTATIDGSLRQPFGRPVCFSNGARRPTGIYLAAGGVATVTVPAAFVGKGSILVSRPGRRILAILSARKQHGVT